MSDVELTLPLDRDQVANPRTTGYASDAPVGDDIDAANEMLSAAALAYGDAERFRLVKRADAPPIGAELDALTEFRASARRLKAAQAAFVDAQQAYGEAVKRLSDEAVK